MLGGTVHISMAPRPPSERFDMLYLCDNQHPQIVHTEGGDCPLCLAETRWVEDALKFEDYKAEEELRRELEEKEN